MRTFVLLQAVALLTVHAFGIGNNTITVLAQSPDPNQVIGDLPGYPVEGTDGTVYWSEDLQAGSDRVGRVYSAVSQRVQPN
jgi:hypothetical protein